MSKILDGRGQIRKQYKKKRDAMPSALVCQLSARISKAILAWEVYQNAQTVFFYYPLGNEVSLLPVIEDALRAGKHAAFPKTAGEHMDFYEVACLQELKEGCFHVMEPESGKREPVLEPDLCFVPGIVFDWSGGRFGYGRGYYDRYFAKRHAVKLAGCAYGCQVTERLPVNAWDVKMDFLVSENGIFSIRQDGRLCVSANQGNSYISSCDW